MGTLANKIDFMVLCTVNNANPNGDPIDGNRPRTTYSGHGEISDVCIKRKIRNRLQDMGESIFVQMEERCDDKKKSLKERADDNIPKKPNNEKYTKEEYSAIACEKWIDVRSFGQVFAFSSKSSDKKKENESKKKEKGAGVSVGVRGPVTLHQALSVSPVDVSTMQITKSVNSETTSDGGKSSDTMGSKHMVAFGLYVIKGSINVQLAEKTKFSEEDAEKIKECLRTLFVNDCSAARPDGSMEVCRVYWWKHNNKIGQYSSAKVHNTIKITPKDGVDVPASFDDYDICETDLEGLKPEIIEGI